MVRRLLILMPSLTMVPERTIILPAAVKYLGLKEEPEFLMLRTVRQDIVHLQGASVTLEISAMSNLGVRHKLNRAFTVA